MPETKTNYADVHLFHRHFGLPAPTTPTALTQDVFEFRLKFMKEELTEFREAYFLLSGVEQLAFMADALIDLVYVAMGTAVMMGIPWQLLWDEVQRKNMSKVKVASAADSKRGHAFDIKKPEGWTPPDLEALLHEFVRRQQLFSPVAGLPDAATVERGLGDPNDRTPEISGNPPKSGWYCTGCGGHFFGKFCDACDGLGKPLVKGSPL